MSDIYDDEELEGLLARRAAHWSRRRVLNLQAATFGYHVPPHIITELREIARTLTQLNALIEAIEHAREG